MWPWWAKNATLASALCCLLVAGCFGSDEDGEPAPASDPLAAKLAAAYRIDVSEIDATLDFMPQRRLVRGSAVVRFEMRPGQTRPLFHLNPVRGSDPRILSVELDGERLDPESEADLKSVIPVPSAERAYELQRDVDAGEEHTLQVSWSAPNDVAEERERWLFTTFDDTEGPDDETETLWPTVSSPEELARQVIHLRVHSSEPYVALGSGKVTREDAGDAQGWAIDTGEAVSSSTVFAAAVPSEDVSISRFRQSGVDVSLVSAIDRRRTERAREIMRETIPRLIEDFGAPFPMPRLHFLLTSWGSGMEYYGASRTGLGSLEHELGHMYFGVTTVNRTWRDTWFDEAAVSFWESHGDPGPIDRDFVGRLADRTPVSPGFNEAAYGRGAIVLGWVAEALGGRQQMLDFLADLHARRALEPFTTDDLIEDILAAQDEITRADQERWFYGRR